MRLLYITSEVVPLAKTGGLADVSAALPKHFVGLNVDVRILLPGYPQALASVISPRRVARFHGLLGCGDTELVAGRLPGSDVPIWLVNCPSLYDRPGGIYQNAEKTDWHDNALRFALLNHVGAMVANGSAQQSWQPDIVHLQDWHASLVPLLLSSRKPKLATVLTIHNLAYQGLFSWQQLGLLNLPNDPCSYANIEFYGQLSFLKAGVVLADALTTVSDTYAKEILTPEFGCGLDGVLRARADPLLGIRNGVDYQIWDPETDCHIASNYSPSRPSGKQSCKAMLQIELGLTPGAMTPLIAFMSRLVHQKMPDLVLEALPAILGLGAQFALLGEGDLETESRFRALAREFPGQVSVEIGYREAAARRLLAGADMLLHPSRFEPCALTPLYAMRYGAIPVVRRTGGIADSVVDISDQTIEQKTGTGFAFEGMNAESLVACVARALGLYGQPTAWRIIQSAAMEKIFSWDQSARDYIALFETLLTRQSDTMGARKSNGAWNGASVGPEPNGTQGLTRLNGHALNKPIYTNQPQVSSDRRADGTCAAGQAPAQPEAEAT